MVSSENFTDSDFLNRVSYFNAMPCLILNEKILQFMRLILRNSGKIKVIIIVIFNFSPIIIRVIATFLFQKPAFNGWLEAGDLLYLPRGFIHQVWWNEVLTVRICIYIVLGENRFSNSLPPCHSERVPKYHLLASVRKWIDAIFGNNDWSLSAIEKIASSNALGYDWNCGRWL